MTQILLVDDDDKQRKLSRALLEDAGYCVADAANASDALQSAREHLPDVILSDVMMDRVDGFGLCRRLQDDAQLSAIPVVLVSAHFDYPSARELAKTLGASALISRTPDFSAELRSIDACLGTRPSPQVSRHDGYEAHLAATSTQLRMLLEQTQRAELRWRSVFANAHDGIALLTPEGIIVEANKRWEQILGVAAETIIGNHLREYAASGQEAQNVALFEKLIECGTQEVRVALRHANGSTVHVDFAACVVDLDGSPHVIAIGRDVTERMKLEERLAHAQRLDTIGHLTGGITHDFNNILCAILASSAVLVEELASDDPHRVEAEQIHEATLRAAALTKQLLAFSRRQVLALADVDLDDVVRSSSGMLRRLLGRGVELVIAEGTAAPTIRADVVQLEQVIVNLAVNARDAMPAGGRLVIATSEVRVDKDEQVRAGDYVVLSVSDTGCGMTDDIRRHLFEPFFTTKERGHGTGLGLSTSYGIVKQLGGEIVVTSTLGRGTTMKVYLPRAERDAPSLDSR